MGAAKGGDKPKLHLKDKFFRMGAGGSKLALGAL